MKSIVLLLALCVAQRSHAQGTTLTGMVQETESTHGFPAATLLFKQGEATVTGAGTDSDGHFRVDSISPGTYDVEIQALGFRLRTVRGVIVTAASGPLMLDFPGPCTFLYSGNRRPACIGGHTDHLQPIVYGLPGKKTMTQAKAGKIYLGGCQLTGCDPHYYCPIHQKEL
jgi:expansin (peptidoglycan-binding protein)